MTGRLPPMVSPFDLERFLGSWHIVQSNYSFWKNRTHPTVTYERLPDPNRVSLLDTLHFRKGGKAKTLAGVDVQDPKLPAHFVWRGSGLLRIIKSPWYVIAVGDRYQWAVTYFARSNVGTGAGMDLYSRTPTLPPDEARAIWQRVREHPFVREHSEGLFETVQTV